MVDELCGIALMLSRRLTTAEMATGEQIMFEIRKMDLKQENLYRLDERLVSLFNGQRGFYLVFDDFRTDFGTSITITLAGNVTAFNDRVPIRKPLNARRKNPEDLLCDPNNRFKITKAMPADVQQYVDQCAKSAVERFVAFGTKITRDMLHTRRCP